MNWEARSSAEPKEGEGDTEVKYRKMYDLITQETRELVSDCKATPPVPIRWRIGFI